MAKCLLKAKQTKQSLKKKKNVLKDIKATKNQTQDGK